jgi:5-oxoprolinase (ATP-hydrolysing) subunit A
MGGPLPGRPCRGATTAPVPEVSRIYADLDEEVAGFCDRDLSGAGTAPSRFTHIEKNRAAAGIAANPMDAEPDDRRCAAAGIARHNGRMTVRFHLNADVGEGFGSDAELIEIVTQVNVACGFHAGDPKTMRSLCTLAVENGVMVGAQPSYRDRENFGRVDVEIGYDDLFGDVNEQVETLQSVAERVGAVVAYLKPHGALYNRIVHDQEQARAVVDVALRHGLPLMTLPGSVAQRLVEAGGGTVIREFFADRAYTADGRLVSRSVPGSLLTDPKQVGGRVRRLLDTGAVTTIDGQDIEVEVDSICVHGDTPHAGDLARAARDALGLAAR